MNQNRLFLEKDEFGATDEMAQVLNALHDITRRRIVELLADGPLCVTMIVQMLGVPQPTVSHHLGILRLSGLVETRREGKRIFYKLPAGKIETNPTPGGKRTRQGDSQDVLVLTINCRNGMSLTLNTFVPSTRSAGTSKQHAKAA